MRNKRKLTLHAEHRSARSLEPIAMQLKHQPAPHLVCSEHQHQPTANEPDRLSPLAAQIKHLLEVKGRPLSTTELRNCLRCRRSSVVEAIGILQRENIVTRTSNGVVLCAELAKKAPAE